LPAEKYGEIQFITAKDFSSVRNSLNNAAMLDEIRFVVNKIDADVDHLVIAGSPYVAAVVFYWLGKRGVQTLNMLRWSNRDLVYVPITLDLTEKRV
jgi:hypothetical protein